MSKTQAFKAFQLIMRCLLWIMFQMDGVGIRRIEADYVKFMEENDVQIFN